MFRTWPQVLPFQQQQYFLCAITSYHIPPNSYAGLTVYVSINNQKAGVVKSLWSYLS